MTIDNCKCPECGSEFNPRENCWHVCNQCFQIDGPDDGSHKAEGKCIRRLGSRHMQYTLEDAVRLQQRKILRMRPPMSHDEITEIMASLEEGDEVMLKQFNHTDVFTEIVVQDNKGDVIKAESQGVRGSPWDLWVDNQGTPLAQRRNHNDHQEIYRLEVFNFDGK